MNTYLVTYRPITSTLTESCMYLNYPDYKDLQDKVSFNVYQCIIEAESPKEIFALHDRYKKANGLSSLDRPKDVSIMRLQTTYEQTSGFIHSHILKIEEVQRMY